MLQKIIALTFILTVSISGFSQEEVHSTEVDSIQLPKKGPNSPSLFHTKTDIGTHLPLLGDDAVPTTLRSGEFVFGFRYQKKLANFMSFGIGGGYYYNQVYFQQNNAKTVPTNATFKNERITNHRVYAELAPRFHFGKRGNVMGKWLEVGGYAFYNFTSKYTGVYNTSDSLFVNNSGFAGTDFKGSIKTSVRNIQFTEPLGYGAMLRFGVNKTSFYIKYRLSDYFKPSYYTAQPGVITIGITEEIY